MMPTSPRDTPRRSRVALAIAVALLAALPAATLASQADGAIEAYIAAYNTKDARALAAVYTEDAVFEDVAQRKEVVGRAAIGDMLFGLVGMHTEMHVRETRRATTGKLVIVEVVYAGTVDPSLLGRGDLGPISYELPAVLVFEVEKGRIARQTDYLDFRTLTETFEELMS